MRWALLSPQAHVDLHGTLGVDGEANIGIDGNTEEARIGVDKLIDVPNHRVPQDTSIIQICQTSHIIRAVELGRVDLTNLVLLEDFDLKRNRNPNFFPFRFHFDNFISFFTFSVLNIFR